MLRLGNVGTILLSLPGAKYVAALTTAVLTANRTWTLPDATGTIALTSLLPASAVCWFAKDTAPDGWLECDGSAVSRTTYATLFAAIGTTFGDGDGSTTFELPDLRGEFVRGWDHGRGVDDSRTFGSSQTDDFKSHTHPQADGTSANVSGSLTFNLSTVNASTKLTTGATGGTETRPRNVALLPCIKT